MPHKLKYLLHGMSKLVGNNGVGNYSSTYLKFRLYSRVKTTDIQP